MSQQQQRELTLSEFEQLLDRFGGREQDWPESSRASARALLELSAQARAVHAEQIAVEALLTARVAVEPSPELRRRIAEVPARSAHATHEALGSAFLRGWRHLTAGAFALCLGFFGGWIAPDTLDPLSEASSMEDEDEEWNELSALALAEELTEEEP